jgi:hypothetical protein
MKLFTVRSLSAVSLFGAVLLAACGGGDNGGDYFGLDGGSSSGSGTRDGGSVGEHDSGTSSGGEQDSGSAGNDTGTSSGGGTCGACTTDSDCQSSCPPVAGGGTNCCDVGSGVCYATTQNTCPVPSDGGAD